MRRKAAANAIRLHQHNPQTYENNFLLYENCVFFFRTGNPGGCTCACGYLFVDKLPI
jgi:hypothetical protein